MNAPRTNGQNCAEAVPSLLAMSRRHGDTPLGNRFVNLAQKLKARAECQDIARRLEIDRNIRRDLAEINSLQR